MLKKLLCAVGLCIAAGSAIAQETHWWFRYTGFQDGETGEYVPNFASAGDFVGEDLDGNGILQQSELSKFELDGWTDLIDPRLCSPYWSCELTGFRYNLRNGELAFTAYIEYRDQVASTIFTMVAGDYIRSSGYTPGGGVTASTWLWTDQTRFQITPPPVPEPSVAWLLGAGLMAVGAAARRRR